MPVIDIQERIIKNFSLFQYLKIQETVEPVLTVDSKKVIGASMVDIAVSLEGSAGLNNKFLQGLLGVRNILANCCDTNTIDTYVARYFWKSVFNACNGDQHAQKFVEAQLISTFIQRRLVWAKS